MTLGSSHLTRAAAAAMQQPTCQQGDDEGDQQQRVLIEPSDPAPKGWLLHVCCWQLKGFGVHNSWHWRQAAGVQASALDPA